MIEMNRDIRYFTRETDESFYQWLHEVKKLMKSEHGVEMAFHEYQNATTEEVLEIGMKAPIGEGHGIGYVLTCGNLLNKEMVVIF